MAPTHCKGCSLSQCTLSWSLSSALLDDELRTPPAPLLSIRTLEGSTTLGHLSVDDQNFDDNNQDSDESYADHGHHHANVVQKPLLLLLPFDLFVDFFLCFLILHLEDEMLLYVLCHGVQRTVIVPRMFEKDDLESEVG